MIDVDDQGILTCSLRRSGGSWTPSGFGDLAFFDCGGVRLFLSAEDGGDRAAKAVPAEPSILYFRVPDIHAAYATLASRGVKFRGAPHLIYKHEDGAEEWMAFFDDPDGHPLALIHQLDAPEPAERLPEPGSAG